jgi:His/Glu/Gln/Arg/opine family amino acid ABC transporter permease subunit
MTLNFEWIPEFLDFFLAAAVISLQVLVGSAVLSLILGLVLGQGLSSHRWWVRLPTRLYVDFFRLTPILVQILAVFFLLPALTGSRVNTLYSGILALGLNYAAFFAEVFKAGIASIERGQWEAADAMGMSRLQVLRRVVYPQGIRRMLPPIGNMLITLTKDTSLVSVIGVSELLNTSQSVGAQTFQNLSTLLFISLFYLAVNIPLALLTTRLHNQQVVNA